MVCAFLVWGPVLGGDLEEEGENCSVLHHRSKQRLNTKHITRTFNRHLPGLGGREPSLPAGNL